MKPLFNKNCRLVGWVQNHKNIFDISLRWVAFISEGNVWSSDNTNWLGPIKGLVCLDRNGKVLFWNPDYKIKGSPRPLNPLRPLKPLTPLAPLIPLTPVTPVTPLTPLGGWSNLTWNEWLNQK